MGKAIVISIKTLPHVAPRKANDQGLGGGMAITQDQFAQLEELIVSMASQKFK
jgi:hypothetical protein